MKGVLYVVAQCAGAAAGAGILKSLTPDKVQDKLGATSVDPTMTVLQGFAVELLITFVLVLTVFASCDSNRTDLHGSAPLAVGLSVTVCHLFAVSQFHQSREPFELTKLEVTLNIPLLQCS